MQKENLTLPQSIHRHCYIIIVSDYHTIAHVNNSLQTSICDKD